MSSSNDDIIFNYVTVQDRPVLKLHYAEIRQENPNAKLIILLHGFGEYWYAWSDIMPILAKEGHHIVAPDLRGFNKSDRPDSKKDYDIKYLVNDVKELIRSLGKENAIVVGHDWGGSITWELADNFPEVCESIIVLNSPHRGAYAKNIRKNIFINLRQSLRSWYIYFFQLPWLPEFALRCCNFKWFKYNITAWLIKKNAVTSDRLEKYVSAYSQKGALTAGLNLYRANTNGEFGKGVIKAALGFKKFNKIKVPALLIWAENDIALEKALTYEMEEFFEKPLKIEYIPNCSHWVHLEQPDKVACLIKKFIATVSFVQ
jgi:epoxide hydrolase 4